MFITGGFYFLLMSLDSTKTFISVTLSFKTTIFQLLNQNSQFDRFKHCLSIFNQRIDSYIRAPRQLVVSDKTYCTEGACERAFIFSILSMLPEYGKKELKHCPIKITFYDLYFSL